MPLTIGSQLGSHEITALLGKGGMGEVYRARDQLKREVAIKILPEEFSRDTDRVSRFQREAEVLASFNHPNIAAIYDLQEANETRYLVLELVEGETLADTGSWAVRAAFGIHNDLRDNLGNPGSAQSTVQCPRASTGDERVPSSASAQKECHAAAICGPGISPTGHGSRSSTASR
jgi:hypothetical protein